MGKAVRLDKFLADSGAGTRTDVKKLIQKGMVQVNGEKVKKPELKVDPENDVVELGGERLGARAEFMYYLLHKPAGYVSATEDTVSDTRSPITIPSPIKNSINPRTFPISYTVLSLWFSIFYAGRPLLNTFADFLCLLTCKNTFQNPVSLSLD